MTMLTVIHPESVFIVSGGARGITSKCVIELAQNYPCKFILLGRSPLLETEPIWAQNCQDEASLKKQIMQHLLEQGEKPTPLGVQKIYQQIAANREIKQTLTTIQQTGSYGEYLSVDVTDAEALQQAIQTVSDRVGKITGIIHGAGNLADKLIEKKTGDDFEKVYTAKVQGLENLLTAINHQQLEYLVLFSSVTGFYGNIGQSDYAIANEILNKSAHLVKQRHPGCHVVAINWGGWDSGMVTPQLKKEFAKRGIEILPVEVGTKMFVNELHSANHETTQVVIGAPMFPPPVPLDTELKTYRIRRQLTAAANPFLVDHVISGNLVLPATCAMSWMINVCEYLYPGYQLFRASEFKVLKGIIVKENISSEYIVEVQELEKINGEKVEAQVKILSYTDVGRVTYHFSTKTLLVREIPPAPVYENINLVADNIITTQGSDFYRTSPSALFHGPTFQSIQRVINISPEKITTACYWKSINSTQQGQFPYDWVNPYAADLSTHPLWIWLYHYHQQICLPGQTNIYEQFSRTPCDELYYVSCEIKQKTAASIIADFIIHDQDGKVFYRLLGTRGIILPKLLD